MNRHINFLIQLSLNIGSFLLMLQFFAGPTVEAATQPSAQGKSAKSATRTAQRGPASTTTKSPTPPPTAVNSANTLANETRIQTVEEKQQELARIGKKDPMLRMAIETAVARLVVPKFSLGTSAKPIRKGYQSIADEFQDQLIAQLNQVSYLEVVSSERTLNKNVSQVKSAAAQEASDGVLTGAVQNKTLQLSIRSGHSGRVLMNWTIPFNLPLEKRENLDGLIQDTVEAIVNSFPYRGYITDVKNETVRLNIGRLQALKKGDMLSVFEFEDERATFSSPKKYLGKIEIVRLGKEASSGRIVDGNREIGEYAKLDFNQDERPSSTPRLNSLYYDSFWLGAGAGSYFLDTQASGTLASLTKRLFEVTLTPMLTLAGGWKGLFVDANLATAANTLQSVNMMNFQAHYGLLNFNWGKFNIIGSVGGVLYLTTVELADPAGTATLISHQEQAPSLELRLQYPISPRVRLFVHSRLRWPLASRDAESGENVPAQSMGAGATGGLRMDLSPTWAIENAFGAELRSLRYSDGSALTDLSFAITLQAIKAF